ncbi:MAG: hypothetical protein HGA36_00600 [Candidatus Moranbacteria bacterium]|nr:hypothetical protein [Candidatus Moranbacteria bacterium]
MKTQADLRSDFVMPRAKINGFFDEFPWLQNFYRQYQSDQHKFNGLIDQIYVSGVEPALLEQRPELLGYDEDDDYLCCEKIWLLDKFGSVVAFKTWDLVCEKRFIWFGKKFYRNVDVLQEGLVEPNECVNDALHRLRDSANEVYFILSYFDVNKAVIIYRPPKEMSIMKVIKYKRKLNLENARLEIRAECNAIDAEFISSMGFPEDLLTY